MEKYDDFSFLETIAIEIGHECNLRHEHAMCPAFHLHRPAAPALNDEQVLAIMDEAVDLNFGGYFAFHFYNEPLMYIDRITALKNKRKAYKFLLWSNGTLAKKVIQQGYSLDIFDKIIFTCYHESYRCMLEQVLMNKKNTEIFDPDMDNRLAIYESDIENLFSCKKVYYELPIDYQGMVYLCTYDWDRRYLLGDVTRQSLRDILQSEVYQNLLNANRKMFHTGKIPHLCTICPRPYRGRV